MENHFLILGDYSHVQQVRGECHFLNKQEQENGYLFFFSFSSAKGTKNGKRGGGGGERERGAPTDTFDRGREIVPFFFLIGKVSHGLPPTRADSRSCPSSEAECSSRREPLLSWRPLLNSPTPHPPPSPPASSCRIKIGAHTIKEETRNSSIHGFLSEAIGSKGSRQCAL